ncbi:tRNA-dihydrouridine synthase family protein, partial [bacterium]|nr:tRNA-dihydrouridine synthase family protein [bacterium]
MVETARTLKSKAPAYLIGSIPVRTNLALAPMDGFSDSPFRRIAKRHGAGLLFTEFINAIDVIADNPNLKEKLVFHPEERPIGFQLFDNQLERLLQASKKIFSRYRPDFIDVNLGCPNRRVTSRGAGAALLKKPDEVGRLIETLSREIDLPITAKIRLGPNENEKNFLEIAHVIENNGGQCVSLHARTTEQGLKGPA